MNTELRRMNSCRPSYFFSQEHELSPYLHLNKYGPGATPPLFQFISELLEQYSER